MDPADVEGRTAYHVLNHREGKHAGQFDFYPLLGIRESRLVRGDAVIRALGQVIGRTYPDTLVVASSNFDSHGYYSGPTLYAGLQPNGESCVPYRALLPKGLDGLLVVGRTGGAGSQAGGVPFRGVYPHPRAVTLALAAIGSETAAPAFQALLDRPGTCGHAKVETDPETASVDRMAGALRELHAAVALNRCCDPEGAARKVLESYLSDWRGILIRFAQSTLDGATGSTGLKDKNVADLHG